MTLSWVPRQKVVPFIKMDPPEKEQVCQERWQVKFLVYFCHQLSQAVGRGWELYYPLQNNK